MPAKLTKILFFFTDDQRFDPIAPLGNPCKRRGFCPGCLGLFSQYTSFLLAGNNGGF